MRDSLWQDVRFAARLARNNPIFSGVIVLCLALGIGPSTAAFSLINASLLHPADVENPEQLAAILTKRAGQDRLHEGISYPTYADIRDRSKTLGSVAVEASYRVSVRSGDSSYITECNIVSPNFFDVLGRKALHGEVFHATESDTPGAQPFVVFAHGFWKERFREDPGVVGATMRINGHDFKVIGVMPPSFTGSHSVAQPPFWVSTAMMDQIRPDFPSQRAQRNHSWMDPFGRIKPGSTLKDVQDELASISRELAAEYPQNYEFQSFTAAPFTGIPVSIGNEVGQLVLLAGIVVFLVLLLSCTSTAAMQLARATVRRREIAIRMAVGASRWRILRQLLVESVFIALLAGGLALLMSLWAFESIRYLVPEESRGRYVLGSSLDYKMLAFTIGVSILAGIMFGLTPAWQMSKPDLHAPLKSQDGGGDFCSARIRNVLVAAQFALAVVLLICSALFVKGLRHAQTLDPGFETERMVVFGTDLSLYGYSREKSIPFVSEFLERIGKVPGVVNVSASRFPPLSGGSSETEVVPIREDMSSGERIRVGVNEVGSEYFQTTGIPIVAGRAFGADDQRGAEPVVIINETLARVYGGNEQAIGKMLSGGMGETGRIVGVAKDSKYWNLGEKDIAFVYGSLAQRPLTELTFCIRTEGDAAAMKDILGKEIRALNPDLALSTIRTIEEQARRSLAAARASAILFMALGGLALVLAVIGVYGVVSYSVARRKMEIGVRMALGGQPRDLIALLVRRGLALVAIGAAVGIGVAFGVTGFLAPLLSGSSPRDPFAFVSVPLVLLAVAWLAIYLPARKATQVDPMVVLRYE